MISPNSNLYATDQLIKYVSENPEYTSPEYLNQMEEHILHYSNQLKSIFTEGEMVGIEQILATLDLIQDKISESEKHQISCRKGCFHCCKIGVQISGMEARYILNYCKENSISIDEQYLREQIGMGEYNQLRSTTHAACVFLKGGECAIYSSRPIVCRKYYVVSDPSKCNTFAPNNHGGAVNVFFNWNRELFLSAAVAMLGNESGSMPEMLLKQLSVK